MTSVARKRLLKNRRLTPWSISPANERVVPFPQSALSLQFMNNRAFVKGVKQNLFDVVTFTRASGGGRTNAQGNFEWVGNNVPRIDYGYEAGPNGDLQLRAKGLLIEEQRTNLLTYSSDFANAAWGKFSGVVVQQNAAIAPDGTATACKISGMQVAAGDRISRTVAQATPITATGSVWVKAEGADIGKTVLLSLRRDIGTYADNKTTVTLTGAWQRVQSTLTMLSDNTGLRFIFERGTVDSFYVWGAQLEAGAFPTSYIPTVASQVTRSADVASVNTLSPWYNASEGTIVVEATRFTTSSSTLYQLINDSSNRIWCRSQSGGVLEQFVTVVGGVNQAVLSPAAALTHRSAFAYKANDFAVSLNGASALTDVSGSVPSGITRLDIGHEGATRTNGHIRNISYFDYKFTPEDLRSITTPQAA